LPPTSLSDKWLQKLLRAIEAITPRRRVSANAGWGELSCQASRSMLAFGCPAGRAAAAVGLERAHSARHLRGSSACRFRSESSQFLILALPGRRARIPVALILAALSAAETVYRL
jgi:hypothetical protein